MNNFKGKIKEYPQISIDYFVINNIESCAFFLSHCHADHMQGLEKPAFHRKLNQSCAKLYTSEVTKSLLIADHRYKHLEPFIVTCTVGEAKTFCLNDGLVVPKSTTVIITPLPAGHCPGSVMFLIEGDAGNILYTGDFRLTADDWPKMDSLFAGQNVKTIDCLYLDTTFCKPSASYLPSREESRDAIFNLVDKWLLRSSKNIIYISCPAQYGTEYIFVELSKKYNMKVHVALSKYKKYTAIPEILQHVTTETNTRIHACYAKDLEQDTCKKWSLLPCIARNKQIRWDDILVIRPSTMWFDHHVTVKDVTHKPSEFNYFRILYSMHSSLSEIFSAVEFLSPKEIHPIVIPNGSSEHELKSMLKAILPTPTDENLLSNTAIETCTEDDEALYGSQNTYYTSSQNNCSSEEQDFDSDIVANHHEDESEVAVRKYQHDFNFCPSSSPNDSQTDSEDTSIPSDANDILSKVSGVNSAVQNLKCSPSKLWPNNGIDFANHVLGKTPSPAKKKIKFEDDLEEEDEIFAKIENGDDCDEGDTTQDILF